MMIQTGHVAADADAEVSGLEHRFQRFRILVTAVVASLVASTVLMLLGQG
jgi:hypothetical protein